MKLAGNAFSVYFFNLKNKVINNLYFSFEFLKYRQKIFKHFCHWNKYNVKQFDISILFYRKRWFHVWNHGWVFLKNVFENVSVIRAAKSTRLIFEPVAHFLKMETRRRPANQPVSLKVPRKSNHVPIEYKSGCWYSFIHSFAIFWENK